MPCEYDNEYKCGDSLYDLTKKILGRLKQLVGFGPGGGGGVGGDVTLTVSDIEIGAIEIKDSATDNRATVRNTDPVASDFGLVVRNIPSGTQAVSGPFLTDTQLRATPVPVSGPLTDAQLRAAAVPISVASLPLPTGAATEVTLELARIELVNINGNTGGILNDLDFLTTNSTVDLASRASEATALTLLTTAAFEARINTLGQKTMANSTPVVLASDQSGLPISKTDLTPSAPAAASVGVTSAQAVASNANRKGLILVNTSVNTISLGFGSAAVLNSGVTLYPGDSFTMGEYSFDTGAVNAIASLAASNLAIQEYTT